MSRREDTFDNIYNQLKEWIYMYKKIPSNSSKNIEEKKLGHWCRNKRYKKRTNNLSEDEIKKLEELALWLW